MKTPTLPKLWRGRIPSALTLLASGVLLANAAVAQDSASGEIEEVVITGSYIKGIGTDEASPVEVLNNDYIQKSGAITVGELTQKLAVSTGAETNPDSFTSGELQGWALAETEKSDPRVGLLPYISLRVVVSFGSGSTSRLKRRKRTSIGPPEWS